MLNLDDPGIYARLDPADMRGRIRELPQQCLKAWQRGLDFDLSGDYSGIDRVLILGMGGSAIGGDLLASLLGSESKVPISVHRDYDLPPSVNAGTLVIASSYSGTTEETLSGFNKALATPARKLAVTTGGELKAVAERNGVPVFTIDYAAPPRAALAHSLFPLLAISQRIGLVEEMDGGVAEAAEALERLEQEYDSGHPTSENPAKQLARRLHSRLAVIYGAGILSPVARRWTTQINENSKAWAFYEELPELNHNAVVGYGNPKELGSSIEVILLRSRHLHARTLIRYEGTADMLRRAGISYAIYDGEGESRLSHMMSLILLGDWVSYYLALLYETDPTPVAAIDTLKKRLAQP